MPVTLVTAEKNSSPWLTKQRMVTRTDLSGGWSLRSRCHHGQVLVKALFWVIDRGLPTESSEEKGSIKKAKILKTLIDIHSASS